MTSVRERNESCCNDLSSILRKTIGRAWDQNKRPLVLKSYAPPTELFENIVGKGKNAGNQHFLLFPQCFLPVPRQHSIFQSHLSCCLQMLSIWTCPNFFSFGKGFQFRIFQHISCGKWLTLYHTIQNLVDAEEEVLWKNC